MSRSLSQAAETRAGTAESVDRSADGDDWTFDGAPTRELTHCYHDYPARMIPQVAGKLLEMFAAPGARLFDPYCGTGTSLVEALARGRSAAGTDLNPLARLIARAKTSAPEARTLAALIEQFDRFAAARATEAAAPQASIEVPGIRHLEFWFKPEVSAHLARLRSFIDEIADEAGRLFFQVAFSETVRESSNTRNDEFKLYRYEAARLAAHNPDVFSIMARKLRRNRAGLEQFRAALSRCDPLPTAQVYDFDTTEGIPAERVAPESADIVITSPPYGDSRTTVAYGQYSRLSSAWLGLAAPERVDARLLGGRAGKEIPAFPSAALNEALALIRQRDEKRAREVAAFYADLGESIANVARVVRPGGHACYVVGNRRVKGVTLPTDDAVRRCFEQQCFQHLATFHRSIPNKRMPLRNSPSNIAGVSDSTMAQEHIVVMRRISGG